MSDTCSQFNPLHSAIKGHSDRCRQCGGTSEEHEEAERRDFEPPDRDREYSDGPMNVCGLFEGRAEYR
jgi:hypothetical protein